MANIVPKNVFTNRLATLAGIGLIISAIFLIVRLASNILNPMYFLSAGGSAYTNASAGVLLILWSTTDEDYMPKGLTRTCWIIMAIGVVMVTMGAYRLQP